MAKMLVGSLAMIVMFGLVSFVGINGLSKVTNDFKDLTAHIDESEIQAHRLDASQESMAYNVVAYAFTGAPKYREGFLEATKEFQDAKSLLEKTSIPLRKRP